MENKNILIIGNGAFGVAMLQILMENKIQNVFMYSKSIEAGLDLMEGKHIAFPNQKILPPKECFSSYSKAFQNKIDLIILCVPSIAINSIYNEIKSYLTKDIIIINTAKGLNPNNNLTWSKLFLENNLVNDYALIVGPSFASEIVNKQKTIVNIVCKNSSTTKLIKSIFENKYFQLIPFDDEYTASLVSSFKNSLALGIGLIKELCNSVNTQSAYLIIGINELQKIVSSITKTCQIRILDFFGVGDIYLTCTSDESRNFQFGNYIGKYGIKKALEKFGNNTIEGLRTLKLINEFIDKYKIDSVLFKTLYEICYKNKDHQSFVDEIWDLFYKQENKN